MNTTEKEFDAVALMRNIREKLHKKYSNHSEQREKELERIRKKYHFDSSVIKRKTE